MTPISRKHILIALLTLCAPFLCPAATESATVFAQTDTRDYTLTVSSELGNPVPAVGTHANYCWRSIVSASVEALVGDRACIGWIGTGSAPSEGWKNSTGDFVLTVPQSSITWQWPYTITFHTVTFSAGAHGTRTGGGELTQQILHGRGAVAPAITPETGWLFSGWSAAFNPVLADLSLQAVYARDPGYARMTVTSAYGNPSPAPGPHMVPKGSTVTHTVPETVLSSASAIHTCTGWMTDQGASGDNDQAVLTLNTDVALTWKWDTQYALGTQVTGPGSVTDAAGFHPAGSVVTLTATPEAGSEFQGWAGSVTGMDPVVEVTMDAAKNVSAAFGGHTVKATLLEVSPARTVWPAPVTFRGAAAASGGANIVRYRWRMIRLTEGAETGDFMDISDQPSFIRADLPAGRWRLYFDALDSTGAWSAPVTSEIRVENSAFLTDLTLARPDLRFFTQAGVELDPMMANQVRLGDRIKVRATVRNTGGLDATNELTVALYDGRGPASLESHDITPGLLATQKVAAIPAGGSVTAELEWHVGYDAVGLALPDCDGSFRLLTALAEFDANRLQALQNAQQGVAADLPVYEASLLNNAAQATVLVGSVSMDDYAMTLSASDVAFRENQKVVISGTARYAWFEGEAARDGAVLGAFVQIQLAGRTLTAQTMAPDGRFMADAGFFSPGSYEVLIQADDGALSAADSAVLTVEPLEIPPPPMADLSVEEVQVAGPGMYETGSTMPHAVAGGKVTVTAVLRNDGNLTAVAPFTVTFYVNEPEQVIGTVIVTESLGTNASRMVTCPALWTPVVPATYSVYAEVDTGQQVPERNELDNSRSLAVAVHEGRPDLSPNYIAGQAVPTLRVSPYKPVQGQPATLWVEIFNVGPVPMAAETFRVVFLADGVTVAETNVTAALESGGSVPVPMTWDTSAFPPGLCTLSVVVDADHAVEEDNENNNTASLIMEILPALPVLVLEEVKKTYPIGNLYAGGVLPLTVRIRNAGGADYESGRFLRIHEGTLDETLAALEVEPLEVGLSTTVDFLWQAPDQPGTYILLFTLEGVVKVFEIEVKPLDEYEPPPPMGDPGLGSLAHLTLRGEPLRGSFVSGAATVHNYGTLPVSNVLVQFYYSVDAVGYVPLGMSQWIDRLAPGTATNLLASANFEAMEPYYTLKVRLTSSGGNNADAGNDVATRSFAIQAPWADAGPDQITVVGHRTELDGTASQFASTYVWSFSARPAGSAAVLSNAESSRPSFVPDVAGTYEIRLQVRDGDLYSPYDWVQVVARAPVAAVLDVSSEQGQPVPAVGSHVVMIGDTLAASAGHLTVDGTNFQCVGWSGTGIIPAEGHTNEASLFVVDKAASLRWLWETNYRVAVSVTGNGTVSGGGYRQAGSTAELVAEPGAGYAFAEWRGALEGCTVQGETVWVPVDRARELTADFRPQAVSGLQAQVTGMNRIDLLWSYGVLLSDVQFRIERLTGGSTTWELLATVSDKSYADETVTDGMSVFYRVIAVAGGLDSAAAEVHAEVPRLPAVPGAVGIIARSSAEAAIVWQSAARATGYTLQRRELPLGQWQTVATVGNVRTWSDFFVTGGNRYAYRVRSVNGSGYSAFSPEVSVTLPAASGLSYGLQVSNVLLTVSGDALDAGGLVLCGSELRGAFDVLLSNPSGVYIQHRVVAGLRDTNGIAVGSAFEIKDLTGIPSALPAWVKGVRMPRGLRMPQESGAYALWIESHLEGGDPLESFAAIARVEETVLARRISEFNVVPPGPLDAFVAADDVIGRTGETILVPLTVGATGEENALSFSMEYDDTYIAFEGLTPVDAMKGCYMEVTPGVSGSVGFLMLLPAGVRLEAGLQIIAFASFRVDENTPDGTTLDVAFTDSPTARRVIDPYANLLPHVFLDGTVRIPAPSWEADVSPRGEPDGNVDSADYVQIMRLVVGLDTPQPGGEFHRADCAPAETKGDGKLDISDAVVAERYASGVLPLTGESEPVDPLTAATTRQALNSLVFETGGVSGIIKLEPESVYGGGILEIPVRLVSEGNVAGIGFSIQFDPSYLTLLGAVPTEQSTDVVAIVNDESSAAGVLGYAARLRSGKTFAEGETTVLTLQFRTAEVAADVVTTVSVTENVTTIVLSDTTGETISVSTQDSQVHLLYVTAEGYPDAITNLSAVAESAERVTLSWSGVPNVTGYALYRRSETDVWALLTELTAYSQSYVDDGLKPEKRYTYRISSLNETGRSGSEQVSVETLSRYQSWARAIGVEESEPNADGDGDGISNYFEYLMGTDPLIPQKDLLQTGFEDPYGMEQPYFTLSFSIDPECSIASLTVDSTTNLTSSIWSTSTEISNVVSNGLRHLKFRAAVPKDNALRQFIRVRSTSFSGAE